MTVTDRLHSQIEVGDWVEYNPACMCAGEVSYVGDDYVKVKPPPYASPGTPWVLVPGRWILTVRKDYHPKWNLPPA